MNVLILGSGGREHALAQAVATSPRLDRLYCLPGNGGTAELATNLDGRLDDFDGLIAAAKAHEIGLTIVGPEAPLCGGIADRFRGAGLAVFGPSGAAAKLEGDKAYAKELMKRARVPTAEARIFTDFNSARTFVATRDYALVVKAAGLAGGKGSIVCEDPADAILALERVMLEGAFGDAGKTVVVEERLKGHEISVHCLVAGDAIYVLETARDYKPLGDADSGPNTGGMGAVSPASHSEDMIAPITKDILIPIIDILRGDGVDYQGVLYAGIMCTAAGPKVLEFNCRFGDPEAQAILPRIRSDALELFEACATGRLEEVQIDWDPRPAVCVVMASEGYPHRYEVGRQITGLEEAAGMENVHVYHAGTKRMGPNIVTNGGRVLGVTALGESVAAARDQAYAAAERIRFEGAAYRRDIGTLR